VKATALTRNGWLLLAGDGLSAFGTWIDFLAILTLAAYQFQVTPYEMALVGAAGLLPGMLTGPRIGRLCDRGDPKRLLMLSMAARAGATVAILLSQGFVLFLVLVALRSVFATVAPPAINVMAVRSLGAQARPRFYSLLNVLNNSAKVLAPALGTISSSLAGETIALAASIVFSAASLVVFAFVSLEPRAETASGEAPAASLRAAGMAPLLWIASTYAFCVFMVNNLVPLVLQQSGFDKAMLGILVSCSGAGNILSGLWLARHAASRGMQGRAGELVAPAMFQAFGFGVIAMVLQWAGVQANFLLPLLFFVMGLASARYAIALNVSLTTHHAQAIGHASGVLQAWQQAMILIAPLVGAVVLERWGPSALFGFATASAAVSFALFFAFRGRLAGGSTASPTPVPASASVPRPGTRGA
jgi:predicted MFS family arabinose efflux permease